MMLALEYITMFRKVSHQFVNNWNGKMIAYEVQKALVCINRARVPQRSIINAITTAVMASWVYVIELHLVARLSGR